MTELVKYPRTPHLASSPGADEDDVRALGVPSGAIVLTEKMDGENTTMTRTRVHARSLDSGAHPSRDWVRALHGNVRHDIPEGMRVCGENLYARHSLGYEDLASFFLVFNIWDGDLCLDWSATLEWCSLLGLLTVPVLYRGPGLDEAGLHRAWAQSRTTTVSEGFVVRKEGSFPREEFGVSVAKWVRPRHVTTTQHWMTQEVVPNSLR